MFIRLGVGYARVVLDVRGWYGMYSRLEFSGYVRKYALCRRGMVAGRSPPYLRLRVHKKAWHLRKYVQRGGVWWQGDRYHTFAFEPAKGTMWMTYHETPRFENIANTLVFLMFPVTPCKRSTSPRDKGKHMRTSKSQCGLRYGNCAVGIGLVEGGWGRSLPTRI